MLHYNGFTIRPIQLKDNTQICNVIKGVFEIANKLYGITFKKIKDIPVWNNEVQTYKAIDEEGDVLRRSLEN